jgi:hypothetical protein
MDPRRLRRPGASGGSIWKKKKPRHGISSFWKYSEGVRGSSAPPGMGHHFGSRTLSIT